MLLRVSCTASRTLLKHCCPLWGAFQAGVYVQLVTLTLLDSVLGQVGALFMLALRICVYVCVCVCWGKYLVCVSSSACLPPGKFLSNIMA